MKRQEQNWLLVSDKYGYPLPGVIEPNGPCLSEVLMQPAVTTVLILKFL